MSVETTWKLKAKTPDGMESYTTDESAVFYPRGTVFTRVKITTGKPETEPERKAKYLSTRKKNSSF
jgi:hypothetical protein